MGIAATAWLLRIELPRPGRGWRLYIQLPALRSGRVLRHSGRHPHERQSAALLVGQGSSAVAPWGGPLSVCSRRRRASDSRSSRASPAHLPMVGRSSPSPLGGRPPLFRGVDSLRALQLQSSRLMVMPCCRGTRYSSFATPATAATEGRPTQRAAACRVVIYTYYVCTYVCMCAARHFVTSTHMSAELLSVELYDYISPVHRVLLRRVYVHYP